MDIHKTNGTEDVFDKMDKLISEQNFAIKADITRLSIETAYQFSEVEDKINIHKLIIEELKEENVQIKELLKKYKIINFIFAIIVTIVFIVHLLV